MKRRKKKAMTSEQARKVRQEGHKDAKEFAQLIGLPTDYQNNSQAKKDVVDLSGDAHSVKSGKKKWQIFLYSITRFKQDAVFKRLNGLGELLRNCLTVFPENRDEYLRQKEQYLNLFRERILELTQKLQNKDTLEAFMDKAFFNAGEVQYLTIKANNAFLVFHKDDVLKVFREYIKVVSSKGSRKVVFKILNDNPKTKKRFQYITIGEIEVRNDSDIHYREMKFWMGKPQTINLLTKHIENVKEVKMGRLRIYGKAIKTFKKY